MHKYTYLIHPRSCPHTATSWPSTPVGRHGPVVSHGWAGIPVARSRRRGLLCGHRDGEVTAHHYLKRTHDCAADLSTSGAVLGPIEGTDIVIGRPGATKRSASELAVPHSLLRSTGSQEIIQTPYTIGVD